jgi:hypothetical protein
MNCQMFCTRGLQAAGVDAPLPQGFSLAIPNIYFNAVLQDLAFGRPVVSTTET